MVAHGEASRIRQGSIHPSAWKGDPPNFASRGFSEVRPGLVHSVDLEAGTCSCEATVAMCRHRRVALIRSHKILKRMEAAYRHELMGEDERLELLGTIRRLRRSVGRA
jgi:hypothetical protein